VAPERVTVDELQNQQGAFRVEAVTGGQQISHVCCARLAPAVVVERGLTADCSLAGMLAFTGLLDEIRGPVPADDLQVLVSPARIDHLEVAFDDRRRADEASLDEVGNGVIDGEVGESHHRQKPVATSQRRVMTPHRQIKRALVFCVIGQCTVGQKRLHV